MGVVRQMIAGWEQKVCSDRYHTSSNLGTALDKARRAKYLRILNRAGESISAKT